MSKTVHLDKDGYSAGDAGVSVNISVDVDTVVCVNPSIQGKDGRHVVKAGSTLNISADSRGGTMTIVLHPGNLKAKCDDGRGDTKGPGG